MKVIMKKISAVFVLLIAVNFCSARYTEQEAIRKFYEGNIAYQKLDYPKSILVYEDLLKNNYRSVEIYFNLGNAYFKSGDFSRAILNYERAKKLEPEDEDIAFNLKIASLKVVDKIDAVPEIFYKRWINRLSLLISPDTWSIILILMVWLMFAAAALYITGRTVAMKKIAFLNIIVFIILTCTSGIMAARSHMRINVDKQAIIMTSSAYVKSSPDEKGNDVFILHEGTRVDVLDEIGEWKKIRIANGNIGWVKGSEMEQI
jgi:tetratricopeptide (TPR) repeat protein